MRLDVLIIARSSAAVINSMNGKIGSLSIADAESPCEDSHLLGALLLEGKILRGRRRNAVCSSYKYAHGCVAVEHY